MCPTASELLGSEQMRGASPDAAASTSARLSVLAPVGSVGREKQVGKWLLGRSPGLCSRMLPLVLQEDPGLPQTQNQDHRGRKRSGALCFVFRE